MIAMLKRLNTAIDASGSVRAIAVLRITLGPIVLLHLRPFLEDVRAGTFYAGRFYEPYFDWFPEASFETYRALMWVAVAAAITTTLGFFSRLSVAYLAGFVGYNLALSTLHFQHNRLFLVFILVAVAALRPGNHLSLDSLIRRRRGLPTNQPARLWPLWLLRIEVCTVYLASATSKLIDQDWWSGQVLRLRAVYTRDLALDSGAPSWAIDLLTDPDFQWWFSKVAVLTEFFIGFCLLHRRTRLAAIWVAVWFHLAIELTARVQVFSYIALAALCIWVTPAERRRQLIVPKDSALARWLPRLDWFARFTVHPDDGSRVLLVDDSAPSPRQSEGRAAARFAWSRLPATFPFVAPALLLRRTRHAGPKAQRPSSPPRPGQ